jgi:UDPglucose--hexose-1-phosphate uridylyltransferase
MMIERTRAHLDAGCAYVSAFINHGKAAGASIEHPHAQLVALDFVPPRVQTRLDRFTGERFATDQTVARVVDGAVDVWCPRAPATPFAIRLTLRDGGARLDELDEAHAKPAAVGLRDAIRRLQAVVGGAAYNVIVETAPRGAGPFHWWIDIVPRLTVMAGFEIGTGVWINIVDPVDAAAALRAAAV